MVGMVALLYSGAVILSSSTRLNMKAKMVACIVRPENTHEHNMSNICSNAFVFSAQYVLMRLNQ